MDVSQLLNQLGFDSDFDYHTGLVKYVHPDLEIQFLTPALGRAKDKPCEIKQLNINAESLTYMKMLQDHKFSMTHDGITAWLPQPEEADTPKRVGRVGIKIKTQAASAGKRRTRRSTRGRSPRRWTHRI